MKGYVVIDNGNTNEREVYYAKNLISSWPKRSLKSPTAPWIPYQILAGRVSNLPDWLVADMLLFKEKNKERIKAYSRRRWADGAWESWDFEKRRAGR